MQYTIRGIIWVYGNNYLDINKIETELDTVECAGMIEI